MERPTVEDFAEYVGIDADEPRLQDVVDTACVLLEDFLSGAFREVPQEVFTNEALRTAHAVYKQSESVGGSTQVFELGMTTNTRTARDPLSSSYPTLRRYVLPF